MSASRKSKTLKYAGIQFIAIQPIESRCATTLASQRASAKRVLPSLQKSNPPCLQHYPGFASSSELFTNEEISEIDNSIKNEKSGKTCLINPTTKLDSLRQATYVGAKLNNTCVLANSSSSSLETDIYNPSKKNLSRCDSLISNHSADGDDRNHIISELDGGPSYFEISQNVTERGKQKSNTKGNGPHNLKFDDSSPKITSDEIKDQVWIYANDKNSGRPEEKWERENVVPLNGMILNGKTQYTLNKGQKRLKKIIKESAPEETITADFDTPSILNKSYCARRVYKYLCNTTTPLPTFLQEEPIDKSKE